MEQEKITIVQLLKDAEQYIHTRQRLATLRATEKAVAAGSAVTAAIVLFSIFLIAFLFASIAAAIAISDYYGKGYLGFLAISGFYLVITILLYIFRERLLKRPMMNAMIKAIFKSETSALHEQH